MVKTFTEARGGDRFVRMFTWVDDKLIPVFGPPPVGPYESTEQMATVECPVCGHAMAEHTIDHTQANTILNCPVPIDHTREKDTSSPLDEFGMPLRTPRSRARSA